MKLRPLEKSGNGGAGLGWMAVDGREGGVGEVRLELQSCSSRWVAEVVGRTVKTRDRDQVSLPPVRGRRRGGGMATALIFSSGPSSGSGLCDPKSGDRLSVLSSKEVVDRRGCQTEGSGRRRAGAAARCYRRRRKGCCKWTAAEQRSVCRGAAALRRRRRRNRWEK
ncbi:P-loop containing nucleoside triphosphatehydrolases superfamily protein [Striga asiatica]|uniref:P-loop containing nucleoside triphosphatehydrolases superfamily protein n=1 Tax=Striga asiatica TaxID=4170 RepID=A0A5A7Q2K7_STRAF|nr:P-loop containing nucleoside triphosphatehydrolases superfamily protein [Striga asiatica]